MQTQADQPQHSTILTLLTWLLRPMLQGAIRFYQSRISPRKGYQCACHAHKGKSSCSEHALQVLEIHPLPTAIKLIRQRSHECRKLSSNNGFTLKKAYLKHGMMAAGLVVLTGCGGGGGGSTGGDTGSNGGGDSGGNNGSGSTTLAGRVLFADPTSSNAQVALAGLDYSTPTTNMTETTSTGGITYTGGGNITFFIGTAQAIIPAKTTITQTDIAAGLCSTVPDPVACQPLAQRNLETFFLTLDSDGNPGNGIQLLPLTDELNLVFTISTDEFQRVLAQQVSASGLAVKPLFTPSLGINTEAPQSEQNSISAPVPFADIFRVARPFREYSCKDATYDEHGWPDPKPASCGYNPIRTFMLDSAVRGSVPDGRYTVLYEGDGTLEYSGYARLLNHTQGRDEIEIILPARLDDVATNNRIGLVVASGSVKNIRIIMPGGICDGNPFVRVDDASSCPSGAYRSFEDTLAANRNAIVFNPDYLNFLKDFRVIRMMNMMEASPSYLACAQTEPDNPNQFILDGNGRPILDETCLVQDFTWDQRSKMDDAVWGASGNIARLERYGRGAPIEVQVELANQLNAHPWFNILHNATDTYIHEFARYVEANLKPGLKAHVEYSNETWNGIFWANRYMQIKGDGLYTAADNPYWDGAYYYATRLRDVFRIWEEEFGGTGRLIRLLGTYQNDSNLTDKMLAYGSTRQYVDAIAMGGYFYACWDRTNTKCTDTTTIPKPLVEATSVDDIFAAIDNPNDPYGMEGVKKQFTSQAAIANKYGKALFAYEGGQHLTIGGTIATDRKQNMIDLMHAANRDPRMGERYQQLLESWKAAGGQTFMLFSVPHTFSQYGSFGIKESLLQARSSAPKYDGAMKFQENQGQCWWNGC